MAHESDELNFGSTDRAQIVKLRVEVRYLSGAMQKLEDHVHDLFKGVTDNFKEQEKRVRTLENFRWWMVGAMIGSGVISAVVNKLLEKL